MQTLTSSQILFVSNFSLIKKALEINKSILGKNSKAGIFLENIKISANTAHAIIKNSIKHSILYNFWTILKAPTV